MKPRYIGIIGIIIGAAGLFTHYAYPTRTLLIATLSLAAAVMLGWFFVIHFEAFRTFSRKRSTYLRLNTLLMAAFFVFILVLINLIIKQYYFRYDMTSMKRFSLSPQSELVSGSIERELTVTYFGIEGNNDYKRAEEILEAYRYLNRNIVYRLHDLDRVPLIAKQYGIKQYGTFVVEYADKSLKDTGASEEILTNLIIRALRKKTLNVQFLTGHGERGMDDKGREGYSVIAEMLRVQGHNVAPLDLISKGGVPIDTDLLVIASPESELTEEDYTRIGAYQGQGGKLLVLLEGAQQMSGFTASMGLKRSEFPIYDTQNVAGTDPSTPLVSRYYGNPITGDFKLSTVFPGVHEIRTNPKVQMKGLSHDFLIRATRDAWYEMNGDGIMQDDEEYGLQVLGILVSTEEKLWRAVFIGDSDFASNAYVNVAGNAQLFQRAANWLMGEGALARVVPPESKLVTMYVTDEQAGLIRLLVPIGIPTLITILGIAAWFRRRSL